MRVGDASRIGRMVKDGHDDKAIKERFKNDYEEDEVSTFIKHHRAANKPAKAVKKKTDPLG